MHVTRRWYYVVPAKGEPRKLVHRIEAGHLDPLPGEKAMYSSWQEQHENLKSLVAPYKTIAISLQISYTSCEAFITPPPLSNFLQETVQLNLSKP